MLPTAEIFPVNLRKIRLKLSSYSRHESQLIYQNTDGRLFFGTFSKPQLPATSADRYHTVVQGEETRLDLIAYKYYRTPELWYIIALANNIVSVFDDIQIGDTLLIPDISAFV